MDFADQFATEADQFATEADKFATEADQFATEADQFATEADQFATEDACLAYLEAVRRPDGYRCPRCQKTVFWKTKRALFHCKSCNYVLLRDRRDSF